MTIPASNWCPLCQEACRDHATICTVCGTALTALPVASVDTATSTSNTSTTTRISLLPNLNEVTGPEIRSVNQQLTALVRSLRQRMDAIETDQARLWRELRTAQHEWQQAPAEWLDPSSGTASSRPTSTAFLQKLPRLVIHPHSSILWHPLVAVDGGDASPWTVGGTLGDFRIPWQAGEWQGTLVRSNGSNKSTITSTSSTATAMVHYTDRGGDETFVQKAIRAQAEGAVACLIGNHVADPWPFVMQDSQKEAPRFNLHIPTILLPKHAAVRFRQLLQPGNTSCVLVHIHIQPTAHRDCVICTEGFKEGDTVLRLPECGHVFHEFCALPWLNKQHTCPYCRSALPTDDQARRMQEAERSGQAASDGFYG